MQFNVIRAARVSQKINRYRIQRDVFERDLLDFLLFLLVLLLPAAGKKENGGDARRAKQEGRGGENDEQFLLVYLFFAVFGFPVIVFLVGRCRDIFIFGFILIVGHGESLLLDCASFVIARTNPIHGEFAWDSKARKVANVAAARRIGVLPAFGDREIVIDPWT